MLGAGPSLDPSILGLRDANSAKVETPIPGYSSPPDARVRYDTQGGPDGAQPPGHLSSKSRNMRGMISGDERWRHQRPARSAASIRQFAKAVLLEHEKDLLRMVGAQICGPAFVRL